ncbi:MAG: hypothetical protein KAI81_09795 [Candidatus Marinimicrobia bacterium]|nr:hypothetical protein [Candidatus Neomarinimicrobiota bacterium]
MSHVIEIPLQGDAESVYQKAKSRAEANGISLDGNAQSGSFAGLGSQGSYVLESKTIKVTITKKPAMFPQAMIDAMVKKMFG